MEEISYPIVDQNGKKVGDLPLNPFVFGQPSRGDIVHDVVVWQRNKARAGTHDCLHKGEMKGGGKKPWKQKGTGRARVGSTNSPLWVGGAVAHGPRPRKYDTRVSRRRRVEGLTSVLSDKVRDKTLVVVDSFDLKNKKTKEAQAVLSTLTGSKEKISCIVTTVQGSDAVELQVRNLADSKFLKIEGINVFDLLKHKYFVCTKDAVQALEERLTGGSAE